MPGHNMTTESKSALSANAAAHVNHAIAAMYVLGGVYIFTTCFRIEGVKPADLWIVGSGGTLVFGSAAMLFIKGVFTPRSYTEAAIAIGISAVVLTAMIAYSREVVEQMAAAHQEIAEKEKARCLKFGPELFASLPEMQRTCQKHWKPLATKP